jgi:hypothetical protein
MNFTIFKDIIKIIIYYSFYLLLSFDIIFLLLLIILKEYVRNLKKISIKVKLRINEGPFSFQTINY